MNKIFGMKRIQLFLVFLSSIAIGQFALAQAGSTFSNPEVVSTLPLLEKGETTCGFGNNYGINSIACGSNFITGEEKIYSYTPVVDMSNIQVSMTNISDNFSGLFIVDDTLGRGACLGSAYGPDANDRIIDNLSFVAGKTYYFIVSSWANPLCLSFDFQVLDQTCAAPSLLNVNSIENDGATINWQEMGTATSWEVQYGTVGFSIGNGISQITNAPEYIISALNPSTSYEAYVRAVCGSSSSSYWFGPITFTTTCAPLTDFVENFDLYSSNVVPECWGTIVNSTSEYVVVETNSSSSSANSGQMSVKFYNYDELSAEMYLVLPPLVNVAAETHRLGFYAKDSKLAKLVVGTMSDPSDVLTFDAHDTITTAKQYEKYYSYFNNYKGTGKYIAIKFLPESTYDNLYLDDVVWEAIPSCPTPLDLTAMATDVTADLSWSDFSSAKTWEIEYGTSDFTQGTGTSIIATSNPVALSGLTSSTEYEYYVRAICSPNDNSLWAGPFKFGTTCGLFTFPWLDDVESHDVTTKSEITDCWLASPSFVSSYGWCIDGSGSTPNSLTGPSGAYSGDKYFYVNGGTGAIGSVAVLTSPIIDLKGATNPRFDFRYHMYGQAIGVLYIEALKGTTWEMIDSIVGEQQTSANDAWEVRANYLTGYTGTTRVRFTTQKASTSRQGDISIDDIQIISAPACQEPTGLVENGTTVNEATISWTENGSATEWEIEYGPKGFVQGNGTVLSTTTNPHTLTGLASGEHFDFYVKSKCAINNESVISAKGIFTTHCAVESLPYHESFDHWPLSCWLMDGGTDSWEEYTSNGVSVAMAKFSSWSKGKIAYLTSPEININTDGQLSWYWSRGGSTYQDSFAIEARVLPSGNWATIWSNSGSDLESNDGAVRSKPGSFIKSVITLDPAIYTGNDVQFRLYGYGFGYGASMFVKDIFVEAVPSCIAPDTLVANNITATSLSLGWKEMGTANSWDIEYGPVGFIPGSGTEIISATNPVVISGLSPQVTYTFCVKSICGAIDHSLPACNDFRTVCSDVDSFKEGFESVVAPQLPECWSSIVKSTSTSAAVETNRSSSIPNGSMQVRMSNITDLNAELYLVSPELNNLNTETHRLKFFAKDVDANPIEIGTMSDPNDASTFTVIETIIPTSSFDEYFITLGAYAGTDTYIAFKANLKGVYNNLFLDEIVWESRPSCIRPFNLNAVIKSTTSANLSWTEGASATNWLIEYGGSGFTPGTGTAIAVTANPYLLTGLYPDNNNEFYIRSVCGSAIGDTSEFAGPYPFYTGYCSAKPRSTRGLGITNVTMGSINNQTTNEANNYGDYTHFVTSVAQSNFIDVSVEVNTNNTFTDMMVVAWIDFDDNYVFDDSEKFIIGTTPKTNPSGPSVASKAIQIPLTALVGNHTMRIIAADNWRKIEDATPCYDKTYASVEDYMVDVIAAPTCLAVENIEAVSVSDTEVSLKWDEQNNATQWTIEYGAPGFVTGTTVVVNTNPVTIKGLNSETNYEFAVKANCTSPVSVSDKGKSITVSTLCARVYSPYLDDVESHVAAKEGSISSCWEQDGIIGNYFNWNVNQFGSTPSSNTGPSGAYSGSKFFYVEANYGTSNQSEASLYTPLIDLSGMKLPILKFMYHMYGSRTGNLYVEINDGTSWVTVDSIIGQQQTASTDDWRKKVIVLKGLSTTEFRVRFRAVKGGGSLGDISLDDIKIIDSFHENLAMLNVEIAGDVCGLGDESVKVTFTNSGSDPQSNFDLGYVFENVIIEETYPGTIDAGDTVEYTFKTLAKFSKAEKYSVKAYTALIRDAILTNDTIVRMVGKTLNVSVYPYIETFATGVNGWFIDNSGNGSWAFGKPNKSVLKSTYSDMNAFVVGGLLESYNSNEKSYVYSPCFDFSTLKRPIIQMSIWYESQNNKDGANIEYSVDGGNNWNVLGNAAEGSNWYSSDAISAADNAPGWSGDKDNSSNGWQVASLMANHLAGMSSVKFRVAFYSDARLNYDGIAFDDFSVYESISLGDDTALCSTESLTLKPIETGVNAYSYLWSDNSVTSLQYLDAALLQDGIDTLSVIVSGPGGFKMFDTVIVTIDKPEIALGNDTIVCFGESFELDAGDKFDSYSWSDNSIAQTLAIPTNIVGQIQYSVLALTVNNCSAVDTINVNVNTPVKVDLGRDTIFFDEFRQGTDILLDAGPGFSSYLWNDNSTTQTYLVDPSNDGEISVVVTNSTGCVGADTVKVDFRLGVNSLEVSSIMMYPNPTSDFITINVTNVTALGVVNVNILDITGKVMMTEKLNGNGAVFNETYDVSTLATGTYFVKFEANGEVQIHQFVIK